jgi:hypothetical protein
MTDPEAVTFSGRLFSRADVALIRQAARDYAALGVTEIARTVCEWLDWKRPNGQLKNHECRLLLERLDHQGILSLPALRPSGRRGPRPVRIETPADTPEPIQATVDQLRPLRLILVGKSESTLWRQLVERHHYLGCRVPYGAHLRYFAKSGDDRILACLLWTSPAWKIAARDQWIGWSALQRARNLQYVVNNGRFLILPWVQVKGLASAILAHSARQMPQDWRQHYGYTPPLLETLVDAQRFKGTSCRAANWISLGNTVGGTRTDRLQRTSPIAAKRIFVFPLHRHAQRLLCAADPPTALSQPDG